MHPHTARNHAQFLEIVSKIRNFQNIFGLAVNLKKHIIPSGRKHLSLDHFNEISNLGFEVVQKFKLLGMPFQYILDSKYMHTDYT